MGYMGLQHFDESDNACSLTDTVINVMCDKLSKELNRKSNEFNTCGVVNVALFFEAFIVPNKSFCYLDNIKLDQLTTELINRLTKLIDDSEHSEWDCLSNKRMHINAYKRMLRKIKRKVQTCF
jgi:hypothetical protein